MLGEKIGEFSGKITSNRVMPSNPGVAPSREVCFEETGKLLGIDFRGTVTYSSIAKADGTIYGEGQGIEVSKDGDTLLWRGIGTGRPAPGKPVGCLSFRGCVCFETSAPKLARLNGTCVVFEYEVNEKGETREDLYEWK